MSTVYFDLVDLPKIPDLQNLGIDVPLKKLWIYTKNSQRVYIRAIVTGEKRPPRKNEWYISGAIPEAYRASNDLNIPHLIAKLVCVQKITYWKEV